MAKVIDKKIVLTNEESNLFPTDKEYDIIPNQKGIFLLVEKEIVKEKEAPKQQINNAQESEEVIELIRKGKLSDLVEGKFESTLNDNQKKALLELVLNGQVVVFKLNESYKKGVYRIKEEERNTNREKKESENENATEKSPEQYNLEQDGFLIIKGKDRAANASYEFGRQIKEGLLRGIKSFDGNYYLIQTDLLDAYIQKTILAFQNKPTQSIEELSKNIKTSLMLTKIICEFLKEEGELMEKKKGLIHYIK